MNAKTDSASKMVYLQFLNEEKKDPDLILNDITRDIMEKKLWNSYS